MDARARLIARSAAFLEEVKNRTAGEELEHWLNDTHGPGTVLYEELSRLVRIGIGEGWAANVEIAGPHYRRSRLAEPGSRHYPEARGGAVIALFFLPACRISYDIKPPAA